jgi:hypothetical protein
MPIATPMSAAFDGRGVVDAVAGHGHDFIVGAQRFTMRILCSGETRAKTSMTF